VPKEDWSANNVQKLFTDAGWYPTGRIKSVLDVGCGLSLKSQFIDADIRVGLDLHRPYLESIETDVPYVAICGDARKLKHLFLPKSFDLVLLLDIVEHLDKMGALYLIETAESLARVAVIIETPSGFVPQNLDILGFGANSLQTHRCGWTKKELEDLDYQVLVRPYKMCDRDFKIITCTYDATASLTHAGADSNGDVKYTAALSGAGGNDLSVEHVDTASGGLVVSVTALKVSVDFGGADPTGTQVETAVNALAAAANLVAASTPGTGASAAGTQTEASLTSGTTNSLEDTKIDTTTNKEAPWHEFSLAGVYKLDTGSMVLCTDQTDANSNGILSVWSYGARLPATRALISYELRDGALYVDPELPYANRFDHRSYAVIAPGIPGYLGGSIAVFDGYLGANPQAKLESSPDKWAWRPVEALSPQATILDPAGAGGAAGACLKLYVVHPAGSQLTHVLRMVMYRAPATY